MACSVEPDSLYGRCVQATMDPSPPMKHHAKRTLFSGSAGVFSVSENAVEAENRRDEDDADTRDHSDIAAESGESGSEFEPSDAESSAISGHEDDAPPVRRAGRKRKRADGENAAYGPLAFRCSLCGDRFVDAADRAAHEALPHPFVCEIEACGKSFADEAVAIRHVEDWHHVHESERFACATCDALFSTRHDLAVHQRLQQHGQRDAASAAAPSSSSPLRLFVCDAAATCRQVYQRQDKLAQHRRRYHTPSDDGARFDCSRCDEAFATRHEREIHATAAHPTRSKAATASPCFACEYVGCAKSYSKKEHLTRHVLATHEAPQERPFVCTLCGVRFVYKHALTRHHTNCHTEDVDRPHACAVCLRAFKKKSALQAHAFVHTGVLPFECGDCGARFLKRFQLTRHERCHLAARPSQAQAFLCDHDDCGELLFSVAEKGQHMRDTHGVEVKDEPVEKKALASREGKKARRGERPASAGSSGGRELRCLVCARVFERLQNLRSHLRTHFEALDERKQHACPMAGCDKAYTKKSNVMAHYNAVHDPVKSRRFRCPHAGCDGAFGYKKVLQTHIESIHEKRTMVKKEANEEDEEDASGDERKTRRRGRQAMGVLARVLGVDPMDTKHEKLADGEEDEDEEEV